MDWIDRITQTDKSCNLYKLNKGIELLEKAKQRKQGYEKWNKAAVWFSTYEQEAKIKTASAMIIRLQAYCATQCRIIAQNL